MFDFVRESKCVITNTLKQRFCKDMNLPIKIFEEPYFTHFMNLFDKQFKCVDKYCMFVNLVNFYGSEQEYFEVYNKLKDDVINYLNNNEKMIFFSQVEDMNKYRVKNVGFSTHDIFKSTCDGFYFVSLDMKKGNFTALHHYSPEIVGNKNTYEDFLGLFTDKEYFKMSKYIRQVVFGNVNPKRQVTYEKYLMDIVLSEILNRKLVSADNVMFFSTDEIVLCIPDYAVNHHEVYGTFPTEIEEIVEWANRRNIYIRAEFFELQKIPGTDGYVKKFKYNKDGYDFKCIDSLTFPFVLRAYNDEKPVEEDKVFIYEGKKAKLLENIKVEKV